MMRPGSTRSPTARGAALPRCRALPPHAIRAVRRGSVGSSSVRGIRAAAAGAAAGDAPPSKGTEGPTEAGLQPDSPTATGDQALSELRQLRAAVEQLGAGQEALRQELAAQRAAAAKEARIARLQRAQAVVGSRSGGRLGRHSVDYAVAHALAQLGRGSTEFPALPDCGPAETQAELEALTGLCFRTEQRPAGEAGGQERTWPCRAAALFLRTRYAPCAAAASAVAASAASVLLPRALLPAVRRILRGPRVPLKSGCSRTLLLPPETRRCRSCGSFVPRWSSWARVRIEGLRQELAAAVAELAAQRASAAKEARVARLQRAQALVDSRLVAGINTLDQVVGHALARLLSGSTEFEPMCESCNVAYTQAELEALTGLCFRTERRPAGKAGEQERTWLILVDDAAGRTC
ncbi:hypothetical protein HXX76_002530 [Chlamydomonas incerta]|uniref:Uncharacterized protein n=1 Tax=Chlamydomonas incerta TaxID=51695 RepID=A0A835TKX7_CHLIN|nr:hypothetical protein HXX76_002530 [Chlamydomonas incerta]|eukprot:KAG2442444.1 hypothetical protein HXX76_002530 [Chlamydomonas incerta]